MPCLCDFCSAPDAKWRHPARNFIGYAAGGVVGESVGDWAACHECHSAHTARTEGWAKKTDTEEQ